MLPRHSRPCKAHVNGRGHGMPCPYIFCGGYSQYLWLCLLTVALLGLGCGAGARTPDSHLVTLAGAGPQGRYFKEVAILSKTLTEKMPNVIANGVIGKGMSVGNVKRVAAGRIDGGRCFRFDLENAYRREAHFAQQEMIPVDYDNAKVWMKLGTHLFRVVAVSDIKSYSDLVGRSVVIGGRGTGEEVIAERIFKYFGVTRDNTDFLYIERTDGQDALANRQIDAIAFAYSRNNRGHLSPIFAAREIGTGDRLRRAGAGRCGEAPRRRVFVCAR